MKHALAIDIGTTKISLVHFNLSTMKVVHAVSEDSNSAVPLEDQRMHEQDPEKIWALVQRLMLQLPDRSDIELIAITGQVHGILLLDETNTPRTNLITWRDTRNPINPVGKNYKSKNGCLVQRGYGGSTLPILLKDKTLFDGSALQVTTITSFIMGRLSGSYVIDESVAATLGVFDIKAKKWNTKQLLELGIPLSLFAPTVPSSSIIGTILSPVAQDLGLNKEVKISAPIGDNQAGFIGSLGFCSAGLLNIGTGGQISVPIHEIAVEPSMEIRPLPDGSFMQVYSSLCGGWAYAYLKDFVKRICADFGFTLSDAAVYDKLNELAKEVGPSQTLRVDTQFLGVREVEDILGKITAIDTSNFTLGHLARAFLEGIVRELNPRNMNTEEMRFLVASGNAVRKNPVMLSIIEAEFSCPVRVAPFLEEASIGAILSCAALQDERERKRILNFYGKHFQI